MFKRSEKKIKAVFMMHFQATQVPQLKAKSLMISLVPVGLGKPTVRLPKAPILEGVCTWENPIYETVKLTQEIKSGIIREKFYYLVVATGSSKTGFLGEVSIDFADLAEATKPVKLTLPLQTSKSGAILHVIVQKMQADNDSRHGEENEASIHESPDSDDYNEETSPHDELNGSLEDAESDSNSAKSRDRGISGKLNNQMKSLERKAELSELEAESLRKQIIKETKKGQQLQQQIGCLKEERDLLKVECDKLKLLPKSHNEVAVSSDSQKESDSHRSSFEEMKQKLQGEKHLNKKLKSQLQKTEDSNSEFVLALRDLSKKLEQKNAEISQLSTKMKALYSTQDTLAVTSEDLAKESKNHDEEKNLKQEIEKLYSEIEVHKREKEEIEMELQQLTLDYERLETENKDIHSELQRLTNENMDIQRRFTESMATVKQFKLRVGSLEEELKRKALQHSESLNTIDELQTQIESLQNELENQAQIFDEDLELVSEAKMEQEERAIRAEEALRKAKRSNANAAERLQEELKQLTAEMSVKIDENEKVADQAVMEANELRQRNERLEELFLKAKEDLEISKEKYESKVGNIPEENKGTSGSNKFSQREKDDLERQLASARKEAEKLMQENSSMKSQIDQKKAKEENMHLEVKKLRLKNNEVRNQLHEVELEKENLKQEASKLRGDLRKKQQAMERAAPPQKLMPEQKTSTSGSSSDVSALLSEVASLKEKNKSMEDELKEMHGRYSEISLSFAEVEGERQQLALALRNLKTGKK